MDARINRAVVSTAARRAALLAAVLLASMGAQRRGANFIIETPDPNLAQQIAQAAEKYRHDLAIEWTGEAMPNWSQPCVMEVRVGPHLGAGGATTFVFDHGEVFGWRMSIQGSAERILDSVLPHEITHMIYASHFRQPLPRWADEGGATSVEHFSEKNKQRQMLDQFLRTGRGIAFNQMFAMTEYPSDIMPLYAQGYTLAEFLIQTGGRRKYVEFLGDGLKGDDWPGAIQRHYGIKDLSVLQNTWLAWVRQGYPAIQPRGTSPVATGELLAANQRRPRPEPNLIYRIREKESAAEPLAALVPVAPLSTSPRNDSPAAANSRPTRTMVSAASWSDPTRAVSPSASRLATTDSRTKSTTLAASGWHAPGDTPSTSPSTEPYPTQVTHPQPMEQPRQTILR